MKTERLFNTLLGAGLSWLLSAGAVGCMITGFGLEVGNEAGLMAFCAGVSLLAACFFAFRWGDWVIVGLLALSAGYLWREGTVWAHLAALLRHISTLYNNAYGWGVVTLRGYDGTGPVDLALWIIACFGALGVSWVTVRRKRALWAMPAVILPLVSCLIVTDTAPAALWLYLLMLGVAVLLLTDHVRRRSGRQTLRMTVMATLAAAAALGALFLWAPKESYVNHAEDIGARLMAWSAQFAEDTADAARAITAEITGQPLEEEVDLSRTGPRGTWNNIVLEVRASRDGRVYLREQTYETYTGDGWTASPTRSETFGGGGEDWSVTVRTRSRRSKLLVPYYPAEALELTGGSAASGETGKEYTWSVTDSPAAPSSGVLSKAEITADRSFQDALALPEETARWAEPLAAEITAGLVGEEARAAAIGDYVRASAVYDLKTPRMPSEEGDFARWFLEESDMGYCVHFSTAATVLLRAAGIPARYVTGYAADCTAGQLVEVPAKAAHAWAEYYDSSCNAWVVLEATPSDPAEEETQPETTASSGAAATEGEQVTETTRATVPAETGGAGEAPAETPRRQSGLWKILLVPLVLAGQSLLRHGLAAKRWNRGAPNERALARWRQACTLASCLGEPEPEELRQLAEKARYSRHTLTAEELAAFDRWRREALTRLRRQKLHRRLTAALLRGIF